MSTAAAAEGVARVMFGVSGAALVSWNTGERKDVDAASANNTSDMAVKVAAEAVAFTIGRAEAAADRVDR